MKETVDSFPAELSIRGNHIFYRTLLGQSPIGLYEIKQTRKIPAPILQFNKKKPEC